MADLDVMKKPPSRSDMVMAEMDTPRVFTTIRRLLGENHLERQELLDLLKIAERRHGKPAQPILVESEQSDSAPPESAYEPRGFDGSVAGLVAVYRSHKDSAFAKVRYSTQRHYNVLLDRVIEDCGKVLLPDLNAQAFDAQYKAWIEGGKTAMAHSLMAMFRSLLTFGVIVLDDAECRRLSVILSNMRFKLPRRRDERLTIEQVREIRNKAHELGRHSIALAQAFQSDLKVKQKEILGEWVPLSEPDPSDVVHDGMKWIRGIRWESVDANFILRHTTVRPPKSIEVDLKQHSMIVQELTRENWTLDRNKFPASGPIIVSEFTKRPWITNEYRRIWRKIATAVGVPKEVRNADSRIGSVETEDEDTDAQEAHHRAS